MSILNRVFSVAYVISRKDGIAPWIISNFVRLLFETNGTTRAIRAEANVVVDAEDAALITLD